MSNTPATDWYDDWRGLVDDECWNCGGEGYVAHCFEEYACIDPEGGCDDCMRRCDICNFQTRPPTDQERSP